MTKPLRVFIGWDHTTPDAYEVARASIIRQSSIPLDVQPIRLCDLEGLYRREADPLQSTEFTYTRFLVPALAGYRGLALYFDCDFLWLDDVGRMLAHATGDKAVHCVQHDHRPTETVKGDGKPQTVYPRKNWSSLMLFNCDHPSTRRLTPDEVNCATGAYLHRMQWADTSEIGALPGRWNWLEGYDDPAVPPGAVHFTRGGPWLSKFRNVAYAGAWREELTLHCVRQTSHRK